MLKRQTLFKVLTGLLIFTLFIMYIGSALSSQDTLLPDNPLDKLADNSSNVSLVSGQKDLVHAEVLTDDEDKNEEDADDEDEKQQDEKQETEDKQDSKDDQQSSEEKDTKKDSDTGEEDIHKDGPNDKTGIGGDDRPDRDADSPTIEITKPNGDTAIVVNDYFTTSIINGETVTEQDYSFSIRQYDHAYKVKDVQVRMESKGGIVHNIVDDYSKPVDVQTLLASGKNRLRIAITYEDEQGERFTASRTYLVIYERKSLVITSDLEDKTVSSPDLSFRASAKLGDDPAPIHVEVNGQEVRETTKEQYEVDLNKGDNTIKMTSNHHGKTAVKEYKVHYERPELSIETNLDNQTVTQPEFTFTAKAFDRKEEIGLTVDLNDESIDTNEAGNYAVTLTEGANTFELVAQKGDVTIKEAYTVHYDPDSGGGGEEENKNAPTIEVFDIADGQTLKGATYTFHVRGLTYSGESLTKGNGKISATNNGNPIGVKWLDGAKVSFNLDVVEGENNIVITAVDNEGNTATEELTVTGALAEEGAVIGTTTISVEATTIGLGHLVSPQQIDIIQGENAANVLDRLFKEHGFTYEHTGEPNNSFYLSAIYKPGLVTNPVIPDDLAELVERDLSRFEPDDYLPDSLGEFDFSNGSGWMYSVNGNYPNVGFSDMIFKDGDVVRIRFTLALGSDIGGGMPGTNYHKEW